MRFPSRALLGLICVLLASSLLAEDRRTDKSRLVIMALNAEFLWDGVQPEEGSSDVFFPWKGSISGAAQHMQEVADIIIGANPDIVLLSEVENQTALNTLNSNFLAGRGYAVSFVQGEDTFTGQDVALLSRIDPTETGRTDERSPLPDGGTQGVSKNIFAKFEIGEQRIGLIGLHFLANPSSSSRRPRREAQAEVIRQLAVSLKAQGFAPVVLGDVNDFDGQVLDHVDSTPITDVLDILKRMNAGEAADDLRNAAELVPKQDRHTSFFDANNNGAVDGPHELTSIDHVLLDPTLFASATSATIPKHNPLDDPDHFPVVVTIGPEPEPGPAILPLHYVCECTCTGRTVFIETPVSECEAQTGELCEVVDGATVRANLLGCRKLQTNRGP